MKIETGVMIMKEGTAWGIVHEDGDCTEFGWVAPEDALLRDPKYCLHPEDVTYQGSRYVEELRTGKLVYVERRTEVIMKEPL